MDRIAQLEDHIEWLGGTPPPIKDNYTTTCFPDRREERRYRTGRVEMRYPDGRVVELKPTAASAS